MRLVEIARDKYRVLAMKDRFGNCQALDCVHQVREKHSVLADDAIALLTDLVPRTGPPLRSRRSDAKFLGFSYRSHIRRTKRLNDVWEFRLGVRMTVPALRILWFFDPEDEEQRTIICTNAFTKTGSTPPEPLDEAKELRRQYLRLGISQVGIDPT